MRISRPLVLGLLVLSLAVLAAPASSQAAAPPPAPVPVAILGGLFGEDENEQDENEADEGGSEDGSAAQSSSSDSSGVSLLHVGLILALGAIAAIWISRWFFRIRAWIRRPAS
jgi:hypothetical protein